MKLPAMLRDVTSALAHKPATRLYPYVSSEMPERLRGRLHWDASKCTGCALCVKDCPAHAIDLVVNDKKAKAFVMEYHVDRCIYCAQCTVNCRFNCLELSNADWELAALTREPFLTYYGAPELVQAYLDAQNAPPALEEAQAPAVPAASTPTPAPPAPAGQDAVQAAVETPATPAENG